MKTEKTNPAPTPENDSDSIEAALLWARLGLERTAERIDQAAERFDFDSIRLMRPTQYILSTIVRVLEEKAGPC